MFFKKREELNIIQTNEIIDSIRFGDALNFVKTFDTFLYFECDGKVYGRIDFSLVKKYDEKFILKVEKFDYLEKKDFFSASNFFKKYNTFEAPLIEDGVLFGAYLDNYSYTSLKVVLSEIAYIYDFSDKKILLVHSCCDDEFSLFLKEFLSRINSTLDVVSDFNDFFRVKDNYDQVLFDTYSSYVVAMHFFDLFSIANDWLKYACTYMIYKTYDYNLEIKYYKKYAFDYFSKLKNNDVDVFRLSFEDNDEISKKKNQLKEKYLLNDISFGDSVIDSDTFYLENSSLEYYDFFKNVPFNLTQVEGYNILKDMESKYCNIVDGRRITIGNPADYEKTIYFFGPCFIVGRYVEDKHTIESFLALKLKKLGYNIRVVNCGVFNSVFAQLKLIDLTDFKKGDIIVVFDDYSIDIEGIDVIDLTDVFLSADLNWFTEWFLHCNFKVNEMLADKIYDGLIDYLNKPVGDSVVKQNFDFSIDYYLNKYFGSFDSSKHGTIGSIVMNANPFTNGHLYLVEEALKYVDYLIVFVLSEDKSAFNFFDRFTMVKSGLNGYSNVFVVPSGDLIISNNTFPEYFLKVVDEDVDSNMRRDVEIFSKFIAPRLNIKYRFVGTEEVDEFTLKYNEVMREVLPQYDINFVEIPRKKIDGKVISASVVREKISNCEYDLIKDYVPETTYKYICEEVGI